MARLSASFFWISLSSIFAALAVASPSNCGYSLNFNTTNNNTLMIGGIFRTTSPNPKVNQTWAAELEAAFKANCQILSQQGTLYLGASYSASSAVFYNCVTVVVESYSDDPMDYAAAMVQLVLKGAVAIVGGLNDQQSLALQYRAATTGVPVISPVSQDIDYAQNQAASADRSFRMIPYDLQQGDALGNLTQFLNWTQMGVLSTSSQIMTSQRFAGNLIANNITVCGNKVFTFNIANSALTNSVNDTVDAALASIKTAGCSVTAIFINTPLDLVLLTERIKRAKYFGEGFTYILNLQAGLILDAGGNLTGNYKDVFQGSLFLKARRAVAPEFNFLVGAWAAANANTYPGRVHLVGGTPGPFVVQTLDAMNALHGAFLTLVRAGQNTNLNMLGNTQALFDALTTMGYVFGYGGPFRFDSRRGPAPASFDIANFVGKQLVPVGNFNATDGGTPLSSVRVSLMLEEIIWPGGVTTVPFSNFSVTPIKSFETWFYTDVQNSSAIIVLSICLFFAAIFMALLTYCFVIRPRAPSPATV